MMMTMTMMYRTERTGAAAAASRGTTGMGGESQCHEGDAKSRQSRRGANDGDE